jgi:hypothetical protein
MGIAVHTPHLSTSLLATLDSNISVMATAHMIEALAGKSRGKQDEEGEEKLKNSRRFHGDGSFRVRCPVIVSSQDRDGRRKELC